MKTTFQWTDQWGDAILTLNGEAQELVPLPADKYRSDNWSMNRSVREVVTVGDGISAIRCSIRMEEQPNLMNRLVTAGLDGCRITLTHRACVHEDCELVAAGKVELEFASGPKVYAVRELILAKPDGTTFENLFE